MAAALLAAATLLGCGQSTAPPRSAGPRQVPATLTALHMVSATTGWALAPHGLLRTTDGARTWTSVFGAGEGTLTAGFGGSLDAWVAVSRPGTVTVSRTADGGRVWRAASMVVGTVANELPAKLIDFADPRHGWMWAGSLAAFRAEDGILLATSDGGARWTAVAAAPMAGGGTIPLYGFKTGLLFPTPTEGWLTTGAGDSDGPTGIWQTTDGGRDWKQAALPAGFRGVTLTGVYPLFASARSALFSITTTSTITLITRQAHGAWTVGPALPSPASAPARVSCIDLLHCFAVAGGTLFTSGDGGATWTRSKSEPALDGAVQLDFVSASDGFALVRRQRTSLIVRSTDGGRTWTPLGA